MSNRESDKNSTTPQISVTTVTSVGSIPSVYRLFLTTKKNYMAVGFPRSRKSEQPECARNRHILPTSK